MIKINGVEVAKMFFPDGTQRIKIEDVDVVNPVRVEWFYEPNEEMLLFYVKKHLDTLTSPERIYLVMPYIPNARMDRVSHRTEVFTLKYFAEFINSMNFSHVFVDDPHSNVSVALLDRVVIQAMAVQEFHEQVLAATETDLIVFPDEGSAKRYGMLRGLSNIPFTTASKTRNMANGVIETLELSTTDIEFENKSVLIVDDICSYGGTFLRTVEALAEQNVKNINLCVTHLENSVLKGDLINSPLFDKIYTTNSIFTESSDRVVVMK